MSALHEKPNAEALPSSSGAAIIQDGRFLPPPEDKDGRIWARTTVLVQRSPEELFNLWRAVELAPLWQEQLQEVVVVDATTSRWTAQDGKQQTTWISKILAEEPGRRIVWQTIEGDLDQAGEVIFEPAPGGRGALVIVLMAFKMGKLAAAWEAFVSRSPKQRVIEDLRHFKAFAETGEIPNSQSAPHGDRGTIGRIKRAVYGETIPTPEGATAK